MRQLLFLSPTADSDGVSAQVGSGVVWGGSEEVSTRILREKAPRVPRGCKVHEGSARVLEGVALLGISPELIFLHYYFWVPRILHIPIIPVAQGIPVVRTRLGADLPSRIPATFVSASLDDDRDLAAGFLLSEHAVALGVYVFSPTHISTVFLSKARK